MENDKWKIYSSLLFDFITFVCLRRFEPFFLCDARIFNQQLKRFAIAQSVGDATFAPLLCQGTTHLLWRLARGFRVRINFSVDLFVSDIYFLFIGDSIQQQRAAQITLSLPLQSVARAFPFQFLAARINS